MANRTETLANINAHRAIRGIPALADDAALEAYRSKHAASNPTWFEVEELSGLDLLGEFEKGEENLYFTVMTTGERGFIKF